jgi:anti-anti-sigma factor
VVNSLSARVMTEGAVPVIELDGRIDGEGEPVLLDAWAHAAAGVPRVVLDFAAVEYINSTGLAVIVQLLARARAQGCDVHAVGLSDHYREIFEITRLADFVTLHQDRSAALV